MAFGNSVCTAMEKGRNSIFPLTKGTLAVQRMTIWIIRRRRRRRGKVLSAFFAWNLNCAGFVYPHHYHPPI